MIIKDQIEAVYPLSPLQSGILFETIYAPEMPLYFLQSRFALEGDVDPDVILYAWENVAKRHAVLRTTFVWKRVEKPYQIVFRKVDVAFTQHDCRSVPRHEQESRQRRYLEEDRKQGFDLSKPALFRLTLIRWSEESYELIVSYHHLILDGWSQNLLMNEVLAIYIARRRERDLTLQPPRAYGDYIAWLEQRAWEPAEAFWRSYLKGAPASIRLFEDDATRSSEAGASFVDQQVLLDRVVSDSLRSFTRKHRLTQAIVIQSAWALLLSRYTGVRDVMFGATVSGRSPHFHGCETMIGLFINTLPVRVTVKEEALLTDWLQSLQKAQAAASDFDYIPLTKIQEWSGRRDGAPLFESIIAIENYPRHQFEMPEDSDASRHQPYEKHIQVLSLGTQEGPSRDLTINVLPGAQIRLRVAHARKLLWDDANILRHFANILCSIIMQLAAHPAARVGDIELLTSEEREKLLRAGSGVVCGERRETLGERISEQAAQRPDAVAVVYEQESVSYGELEQRSNQLGHFLRRRGVGPEVCVGVCLERSPEMVVALLGILKAGGAYVPLDPEYPTERLGWMMEDCDPAVVITVPGLADPAETDPRKRLYLDKASAQIAANPTTAPDRGLQPGNLIYTIYTSGSTGRPKGAMNTQAGVSNRLEWMQCTYGFHGGDRVLQKTPMSFDVSVWELFCPLMTGGCLVLARPGGQRDASYLVETIIGEQITIVHFVPSLLELWLDENGVEACESLRLIVSSGEALKPELSHAIRARLNAELENLYGPTEAAVDVTRWRCGSGSEEGNVPIGKPIANTQVYVVDEGMELVPIGGLGELCIGGAGLARGYVNRGDLTGERFVPNPYGGGGERMYRTGDRCRWRADGNLEFVGRVDDQVKVRGYRIELGEIESALRSHAGVREAVVVAREEEGYGKRLVGYVVGAGEGELEAQELRRYVRGKLPEYMVPSTVMVLERLPLTSNGKLDRKGLPKPEWRSGEANYEEPRGPLEEIVANVWKEVLGRERVGREENFFELGGHSLLATQVVSRIRQSLDVELALRVVFELPTVAGMSAEVERARGEGRRGVVPVLSKVERSGDLPLSYAQQRLWFLDQLEPDSAVYNVPHAMRLEGRLDVAALEWSLSEMVRRHEVLRTSFPSVSGTGVQRVSGSWEVQLSVVDVSGDELAARSVVKQEVVKGFDLSGGPVWRAKLVRLGEEEHVLVVVLHHIISDGWSVGIMVRELTALYESRSSGSSSGLEELQVQYGDYAVWQREWLSGEVMDEQVSYWKGQLSELETLELPTDYRRPAVLKREGGKVGIELGEELTRKLEELSRREGVTLFMTLLAGFQVVLGRWSGQRDVAVGTPIAGRRHVETEGLIGFFVNQLVLRTRWEPDTSFVELLQQVRGTVLEAYEHQDVPFEKLVEELEPERTLNRSPLFQVAFVLQNAPERVLHMPGLRVSALPATGSTARFDLSLSMRMHGAGLLGVAEYSSELYCAATIGRLLDHWRTILHNCLEDPEAHAAGLSMLSFQERTELFEEWNATKAGYPDATVLEIFHARAQEAPHSIAVVFEDRNVTYGELKRRSNTLGKYLNRCGVDIDVRVGLLFQRSESIVIAKLAVMGAGGTYVPLSPELPDERQRYMLEDSRVAVLIGDESASKWSERGMRVLHVDDGEGMDGLGDASGLRWCDPSALAYVIYTSGSTGKAKGVEIPHRGLSNLVNWHIDTFSIDRSDRTSHVAGMTFDASEWEIWPSLTAGASLQIANEDDRLDHQELWAWMTRQGVTVSFLPTPIAEFVLSQEWLDTTSLRVLLVGGDCLVRPPSLPHEFLLVNAYGPTENSVVTTTYAVDGKEDGAPPIGKPIANTTVYVLDESQEPVPVGVVGELYTGGAGLARGYSNRGDLTGERFVPNPYGGAGERMYRTGDRCRWRADGNLEFVGRVDDQVKVRGYRIELGEIESALREHEWVRDAVVVARDEGGHKRLVGYVVGAGGKLSSAELREHLRVRLPEYMVPGWFVQLEELPLTAHGKVDRRKLPEPERIETGEGRVGPRNEREAGLARIWEQVLGVEGVGINDNFFELGGDSILSIQIVARARQAGMRITVRDMFQHQTIGGLVEAGLRGERVDAEQGEVRGRVQLTPIQAWYFGRERKEVGHYNQAVLLEGAEGWRGERVERVWEALARQHDALRMKFSYRDGEWEQSNEEWERGETGFAWIDLREIEECDKRRGVEGVNEQLQGSLDLEEGQVARLGYMGLSGGEVRMLVAIHHLVVDGVSWRILLEDLQKGYAQIAGGSEVELGDKTSSYQQWAEALRRWAESAEVKREAEYWEGVEGAGRGQVWRDWEEGANTVDSSESYMVELGEGETEALLRERGKREGAGAQEVLLAAVVEALGENSGTWKWRIDVEGHGRESEVEGVDVTRTVGWFTTIYPVCLGGEGGVGPDERLREIREQMKAVPRRGLGYGLLRYGSSVRLVKQESTEISFNYLGQFDQVLEAAGKLRVGREAMGPVRHRGGTREYVLELVGAVRGGRLQMQFGYSRNVHRRETIEKLAQSFLHAVQQLVRDQETVYSLDGEVIPEREWSHALAEMSSGDQSFDERHIEAVYELTPLQEGILFESMYAPEAALYTVQSCFLLENGVDAAVLRQAWQAVVERHAVLRTAFAWKQVSRPVQIVMRAVELPLVEEDWRDVGSEEQKRRLSEYVQRDGERGFDLSQPPLIRLALMRVGEDAYELICTYHHILLDGWSHYLFLKEVVTHYEALREGQQLRLPLSRPYRDYVKWLRGRDESAAEAFWRKYLTGLERGTGLELSTGKGEPEARGKGEEEIELSAETTQELQRLARQSQVTLNTVVQGAWALTLSLHSGERDVVFGSTVSGRPAELDCEATVGLFINTIPVRVAVRPEMGVDEWLRRLQRQQGDAFAYQYTPLTRIRQWSELGDGDALIESILVYENYPLNAFETSYGMEAIKGGGLRVKLGPTYDRASPTVSLNVWMVGERMKIRISYERQWWGREQMWQVVMRTGNVLRAMAADERRAVGTVDLLSAEERAWVLGQSRGRWRESSKEQVQDRVAKQAVASPESIALSDGEQWVSYAELDRRANQLSRYLRESGVGAEVRVGVCLRPTVELMRVVLGVLKAGGAYVPLDPEYPASRLDYMAEDAQLGVLITEKDLAKRMSAGWMKTIVMDEEEEDEIGRQSDAESNAETEGSNLAYVLYTSGSTGQPKGVMISHEGLSHYLRWCEEEYGMASGWGAPLNSSISFDLSVTAMFGPLVSGRCVRLVGGNVRGVEGLLNLCGEEAGYSFVKVTPSHLKVLREQLGADGVRKLAQRLIVGGETLSWKETGWWGEQAPEVVIVNEYGPTETVVGCVVYEVRQQRGEGDVPIGKPITNTTVYVLDENQESVPVGVAGELYIGGAGVARGYVNRGDLTAERFVPNPYGGAGERMYRTGDRCRWRADGNLEFVGRVDDQVKVRGYRIELGEIESALRSHAGVRDAVVILREDEEGDQRLAAYVVPREQGAAQIGSELAAYLRGKLPEYMVPSTVMVLERLPLTSNGKLDRKGLPKPEWRSGEANYEEPRGPLEEIVANVWKEVLGRERVGREENFFELGGHSLLATQVVSRIRQSLDVELALRVVFELPTVAGMSAEVERARVEGRRGVVPVLSKVERSGDLPLSYAQQRLWFLDQLEPDSAVYNVPHAMRLEGRLDVAALEWSLSEMVRRHEVLRTSFPSVSGTGVQRVSGSWEVQLSVVDVSGDELAARSVVKQEVVKGFDLSGGPVWRAKLVRLGEEEHVLVVVLHHIISDGWSVGIMVRELTALYESRSSGSSSGLEELQVQYGDYAVWQREWLSGEVMDEQVSYWKGQLSELETLELPTDYRRPAVLKREGGKVGIELGEELTRKLEELSRREGVTLFMTLLAGFQVVLGRWSGQRDVAVGTPIAGRRHVETEGLIGFFVNTLVLRTRWEPDTSFVELLQQVRGTVLEAYEHQDVPFEKLVEELEPERTLNRSPLFQVAFVLQNAPGATLRLGEAKLQPFGVDTKTAKFDVALDLSAGAHGVGGVMEYSAELYGPETVARLARHFRQLLETVAGDADLSVAQISLLSAAEREQLVEEWNRTAAAVIAERIDEAFLLQVTATGDSIALAFEDNQMSYGELEKQSGELAKRLRGLGVRAEDRVIVCLERSCGLVVALLGVLRAGAAYVPLNPDYPMYRMLLIEDRAQARVVVTVSSLTGRLPKFSALVVCMDEHQANVLPDREAAGLGSMDGASLAYVMYTSGSMGEPKGVEVEHRSIMRLVKGRRGYALSRVAVLMLLSPVTFDASTFEIWGALANGGRLEIYTPGVPTLEELGRYIEARGVTVLWLTSGLFHQMVDSELGRLKAVQQLLAGGDVLSLPHTMKAAQELAGTKVINGYGPTENTTFTTCHRIEPVSALMSSVPIGKPIANTTVYVLDESQEPVPVGVVGELYTGGAGLARGYSNRGDLTGERFVPNPYGGAGERMYRTGDRCRWRADGNLEFVGRVDDQVKVRGYRIELGEIESALREHEWVRDAVVVARDEGGHKRLVGYVVGAGGKLSSAELREHLRVRLPEYMVPGWFVQLEELPLTAHGKVDRRKLPEPERIETGEGRVGPRNEREAGLARIWEQVLGVEGVGINDNFFELGGDSILSIQIVARARQAGMRITVRDMFQHQTIGGLVEAGLRGERVDAEQGEVRGRVQLTPIQAWYFGRERKEVGHYNQAVLLEGAEGWRGERVERVWEALARQHDALRMKFSYRDGEWEQSNEEWERGETGFAWIDLREIEECDKRRGVEGVNEQLQGSLDLEEGQVARLGYMGLSGGEVRMLVAIHHLVVDGVSWRILLEDLQKGYAQIAGGSEVELGDKTSSYQQWAEALRRWAESAEVKREAEYWEGVEGAGRGQVWRDWEEGANTVDSSESYMVELGEGETEALLRERGKREGAGAQEVLLAAVVEALGENSGTWKWRIDVEGHGRESEVEGVDVTRTVGWFTTIYPVCLGGEGGVGPDERLREIREQMKAVPRRGLGYGLLRYGSSVRLVKQESTEISFNYLGQFDQVLEAAGKLRVGREAMGPVRHRGGTREYVLELVGAVRGGRLQMQFGYSRNVHRRETIEKLAQSFLHAVQQLVHCEANTDEAGSGDFPLANLTEQEMQALFS